MTSIRLAPNHHRLTHEPSSPLTPLAASLVLLFTLGAGCGNEEMATDNVVHVHARTQSDVDPSQDEDTCPRFDARFVAAHQTCDADSDCEMIAVQTSCSGTRELYAVASAERAEVLRCAPDFSDRSCNGEPLPTRAEDGRVSVVEDHSDVAARCIAGQCQSYVHERSCGPNGIQCAQDGICIAYMRSGVADVQYACVENPCSPDKLSCECAEQVCDVGDGEARSCAIDRVSDSDVFCKLMRF